MEQKTLKFAIIRLGKNSVSDIKKLDSLHEEPAAPISLTVSCTQVPLDVGPGFYAFIYLGSDNSKGAPTVWSQGLRAFGKIVRKEGGEKYADKWKVEVEVKVVFPKSINKSDFLAKTPASYYWFSGMPIIGVSSYSNQTIQTIKADEETQNIRALLYAIEEAHSNLREQVNNKYPELNELFSYDPSPSSEYLPPVGGFETPDDYGWGEYPLDAVFVRREQRTVNEIMGRIDQGRYVLDPDFQRDFLWSITKQSRLIESCLMRIPLPVFYLAETDDGKIIVVDGLQRLTTFHRYVNNKFALTGLGKGGGGVHPANPLFRQKNKDLPLHLQERLEDTQLTLYILDAKAPERAKLDIFERVNGGVPLTRQQMRNCLYNGSATRWLKDAAESIAFLKTTGGSLDKKSMRDREAINRFCAFHLLGVENYKGDMDDFLANVLEVMNNLANPELEKLTKDFERTMAANHMLFGKHAFRKSLAENTVNAGRTVINLALFDVCSVLLAELEESFMKRHASYLRGAITSLLNDDFFSDAITYGTNGINQVKTRFKMIKSSIMEIT